MMSRQEKYFLDLFNEFQWKYNLKYYQDSLFAFKNGSCLLEMYNYTGTINQKNFIVRHRLGLNQSFHYKWMYVNYEKIWSVFESEFNMTYNDIVGFLKDMMYKHLKISDAMIHFSLSTRTIEIENSFHYN